MTLDPLRWVGSRGRGRARKELHRHPARIVTMVAVPIPNTTKIGVWRVESNNQHTLVGIGDDPIAIAAAEQAPDN